MENGETTQLNFNEVGREKAALKSKKIRFCFLWTAAMALQAFCGFFVAKIPVRPELAPVSALFVVIFAWPCYRAVVRWLGWRDGVRLLVVLGVFGLLLESAAVVTGWPYGRFVYGDKIGVLLFGIVPWTVPFAWTPLLCAAITQARRWTDTPWKGICISGVLLTVVDIVLDPPAVAQGFWRYQVPGAFYGVPAQNFAGWLLTSSVAAALVWKLVPRLRVETPPPYLIGSSLLILSFWSSVCFWMALWLPAMIGFVMLGILAQTFFLEK